MLKSFYSYECIEAGCDEAGRGCLAGPVFAAAVILPKNFRNEFLNDSKVLTPRQRDKMRILIESEAIAWAVASVDAPEIDKINILNASILSMHKAIAESTNNSAVSSYRWKPFSSVTPVFLIIAL